MSWNYRVVAHETFCVGKDGPEKVTLFSLCEVFYDEKGEPWAYAPADFNNCEEYTDVVGGLSAAMRDVMKSPLLKASDIKANPPWDDDAGSEAKNKEGA